MNIQELDNLFKTDDRYKSIIDESNEWFKPFKLSPDETKSKRAAEYIKKVIGVLSAAKEVLTGNYYSDEYKPKPNSDFNKDSLDIFRDLYLNINYRIALVNREVHEIVNNIHPEDTPYDEVLDMLSNQENEFLKRDHIPQYLIELNVNLI